MSNPRFLVVVGAVVSSRSHSRCFANIRPRASSRRGYSITGWDGRRAHRELMENVTWALPALAEARQEAALHAASEEIAYGAV